ncbi:MAG: hypothetical protein Q8P22_02435, partial [Chloroflexota bacterium]|nr:hypothetical protein [Chloroflexota bacterium]
PGPPSGPIALYVLVVDAETGNVTATSTYRHIENSPFAVPSDQPPLPTLTPTPIPGGAPAHTLSWVDDVANLATYPHVVSVILGRVVGKVGENRAPIEGGVAEWVRYERWQVEVERYLVNPQPYPGATLQFIEGFIRPDGSWLPARFPVSLDPGMRAVFFLTKSLGTAHAALEEGTFTAFLAPGGGGIREVRDGQVSTIRRGQSGWEPLEEFATRVVQAAKEAGKDVGPDKRP